jgi:protein gp37
LGQISLAQWVYFFADDLSDAFHWVIVGGESGPNARPMNPEWVRNLRDECTEVGVTFFFKQWGEWQPRDTPNGEQIFRVGKKAAGNLLDGRQWQQMPEAGAVAE